MRPQVFFFVKDLHFLNGLGNSFPYPLLFSVLYCKFVEILQKRGLNAG